MKSVTYYVGEDFDPSCGSHLTAEQWLHSKILHATNLHHTLAQQSYMNRDELRIKRISSAISYWQEQIDEINGKHKDIQ